ncbi:glycolate oxidase subunit GlcF [Novosphingobium sp.]|uniref:glycolate oxidase subunit GlcF n=1 Tax=Novosphingobium sp. TaxID=1874826 RepID=UPI00333F8395
MQTRFPPAALADPDMAQSESVIRKCVHCGFCTATCPTYVLLGDELDSPRGRIILIKDMLENARQPSAEVVTHIDRCLSCLSCMTTCPSGVHYGHLVDHARAYIDQNYRRPWPDRMIRWVLGQVLPYPARFRAALALGRLAQPLKPLLQRVPALKPVAAMLALVPRRQHAQATSLPAPAPSVTNGPRVILLQGCAEPVLQPAIRVATQRVLARAGCDVVLAQGEGCCGALVHHMGQDAAAKAAARRNIDAWDAVEVAGPVVAIVITTSGCGTSIKDYGFLLRDDPAYAQRAAHFSALARDISEFVATLDMPPVAPAAAPLRVAYHPACSLQHGQGVTDAPRQLLTRAGYTVVTPKEAHLCCGSAGVYNILQPDLADRIGQRKVANLDRLGAAVIAAGNVGCAMQIGQRTATPVVHTIELIDWAQGGPRPYQIPPAQIAES